MEGLFAAYWHVQTITIRSWRLGNEESYTRRPCRSSMIRKTRILMNSGRVAYCRESDLSPKSDMNAVAPT